MSWTDERVETLKRMWAEGLSASQIAKDLGGVTRNAVIGKVHRLGLSNRAEDEAAPAEEDPAEVAGDNRRGVPRVRGAEGLQHRSSGRARGLAVVGGALDGLRCVLVHDERGAVVARVGVALPGCLDDVARLLATVPEWFGQPDSNREYIEDSRRLETWTVRDSAGTVVVDGLTVSATGGSGDVKLDNTSIASGQSVSVSSFTITHA